MLPTTQASEGMTLGAPEPCAIVKASVVRKSAAALEEMAVMSRQSAALCFEGSERSLPAAPMVGAKRRNISATAGSIARGKTRCFSASAMNFPRRTRGLPFSGMEAWPPAERAVKRRSAQPFSPTPIRAKSPFAPLMGSVRIMLPSSKHISKRMPCDRNHCEATSAPWPLVSSVQEEKNQMSREGTKPSERSSSALWSMPQRPALSSSVPRPQSLPSAMSPEKGGCVHSPFASTTSWWFMNRTGRAEGSHPGQRSAKPSSRAVYSQRANTVGKSSRRRRRKDSNFAGSEPESEETVSMRIMRLRAAA